jgi:hypothetical protein
LRKGCKENIWTFGGRSNSFAVFYVGTTYNSVMKIEGIYSTKMFVPICHNPEDHNEY